MERDFEQEFRQLKQMKYRICGTGLPIVRETENHSSDSRNV